MTFSVASDVIAYLMARRNEAAVTNDITPILAIPDGSTISLQAYGAFVQWMNEDADPVFGQPSLAGAIAAIDQLAANLADALATDDITIIRVPPATDPDDWKKLWAWIKTAIAELPWNTNPLPE